MPESTATWRTPANALTLLRLAIAPALAAAILREAWLPATGLFWLAVATDVADGALARRHGQSSPLGGFLDHLTDALFCSVGLAALALQGVVTALLPIGVLVAFTQYAWDSRVVQGKALRASWLGRWNGIAYYVIVAVPIVRDALGLAWPGPVTVQALAWGLVATTVVSIVSRVVSLRRAPGSPV